MSFLFGNGFSRRVSQEGGDQISRSLNNSNPMNSMGSLVVDSVAYEAFERAFGVTSNGLSHSKTFAFK